MNRKKSPPSTPWKQNEGMKKAALKRLLFYGLDGALGGKDGVQPLCHVDDQPITIDLLCHAFLSGFHKQFRAGRGPVVTGKILEQGHGLFLGDPCKGQDHKAGAHHTARTAVHHTAAIVCAHGKGPLVTDAEDIGKSDKKGLGTI